MLFLDAGCMSILDGLVLFALVYFPTQFLGALGDPLFQHLVRFV